MNAPLPVCPTCALPLPSRAPEGLCPRCLLEPSLLVDESPPPVAPGAYSVPSLQELGALLPRYELLETIGRGGMGVVYKARDPKLGRLVAIKVLPAELAAAPSFEQRFEREARTQAALDHPFVATLFDYGEAGPYYYLVLEHVPGGNLRQAMAAGVDPQRALRWIARVCEALAFAHEQGVLHRDIKPENVLVDAAGSPRLADFGLAKLVAREDLPALPSLTGTHALLGSPHYMPPEALQHGAAVVDARGDIYALGVVLYELLTGGLPLGRFPPPSRTPGVPAAFDDVVLRCLERDPAERYPDAAALEADLVRLRERLYPVDPRLRRLAELRRLGAGRFASGAAGVVGSLVSSAVSTAAVGGGRVALRGTRAAGGQLARLSRWAVRPARDEPRHLVALSALALLALVATLVPWSERWGYNTYTVRWVWNDPEHVALGGAFALLLLGAGLHRLVPRLRPPRLLYPLTAGYCLVHWLAYAADVNGNVLLGWWLGALPLLVLPLVAIRLYRSPPADAGAGDEPDEATPLTAAERLPEPEPTEPAPTPTRTP